MKQAQKVTIMGNAGHVLRCDLPNNSNFDLYVMDGHGFIEEIELQLNGHILFRCTPAHYCAMQRFDGDDISTPQSLKIECDGSNDELNHYQLLVHTNEFMRPTEITAFIERDVKRVLDKDVLASELMSMAQSLIPAMLGVNTTSNSVDETWHDEFRCEKCKLCKGCPDTDEPETTQADFESVIAEFCAGWKLAGIK